MLDLCLCRLAPDLKTIFHQCVISYTCSQSYSDGSRAIRVRLPTSIWYDTLKNCLKDWSQSSVCDEVIGSLLELRARELVASF